MPEPVLDTENATNSAVSRRQLADDVVMPLKRLLPDNGHMPSLNGLRAASIALVLGGHYISNWVPGAPSISGQFGVTVFFVISGFLISRLLIAEFQESRTISISKFYYRRAVRLAPVLIAFVLVMGTIGFFLNGSVGVEPACAILYLTNYCNSYDPQIYSSYGSYYLGTWSLSVEEQFYLLAAPMMTFVLSQPVRTRYVVVAIAIILPFLFRIYYTAIDANIQMIMFNAETRFDSLAFGVLGSIAMSHEKGRAVVRKFIGAGGLAAAFLLFAVAVILKRAYSLEWPPTHSFLAAALVIFLINILFNSQIRFAAVLLNWPISDWVGRISYSLYLWHFTAMMLVDRTDLTGWPKVIIATTLAFLFSITSYYTLERYFMKFRQRLH